MGDEFGTVNVRRADRARELEVLRQHYRSHRDSLAALAENAPTDFLATEYQRLIAEIDAALAKLHELEGHGEGAAATKPKTQPGTRPIVHSPAAATDDASAPRTYVSSATPSSAGSRMIAMVVAGVIVLGLIGWLIWRAGGDRRHPATTTTIVDKTVTSTQPATDTAADMTIAPVTPAPVQPPTATAVAAPNSVTLTPALADYGTVRKGTRATRQFQVVNTGAAAIEIKVARSGCRCLYYEYNAKLVPKKKESITVTIDGARAKPGTLAETVQITGKSGSPVLAQFQVQATVR